MWIDGRGSEVLTRNEALRLLAQAGRDGAVGRLGVSQPGAPIIHPVNFSYRERHVLIRLGDGSMAELATASPVSFEVEGSDDEGRLWSVVVRGFAERVEAIGVAGVGLAEPAMRPQPLVPEPGDRLLGVRVDVVSGRRFVPALHARGVGS